MLASVRFAGAPLGSNSIVVPDANLGDGRAVIEVRQQGIKTVVGVNKLEGLTVRATTRREPDRVHAHGEAEGLHQGHGPPRRHRPNRRAGSDESSGGQGAAAAALADAVAVAVADADPDSAAGADASVAAATASSTAAAARGRASAASAARGLAGSVPQLGIAGLVCRADAWLRMRTAALPGALGRSGVALLRPESTVGLVGGQALARRRLLVRAAPFLGAGLLPFATLPLPPSIGSPALVIAAALLSALIVVAAMYAPWQRLPQVAQVVPPMTYFVVIALLRDAENGASGYTPLAMLPLFWLALYGTRLQLGIAIAGVISVFFAPLVLIGAPQYPVSEWRRAILWVAMAALVGFTVQRLVNQLRDRAAESIAPGRGAPSQRAGEPRDADDDGLGRRGDAGRLAGG